MNICRVSFNKENKKRTRCYSQRFMTFILAITHQKESKSISNFKILFIIASQYYRNILLRNHFIICSFKIFSFGKTRINTVFLRYFFTYLKRRNRYFRFFIFIISSSNLHRAMLLKSHRSIVIFLILKSVI